MAKDSGCFCSERVPLLLVRSCSRGHWVPPARPLSAVARDTGCGSVYTCVKGESDHSVPGQLSLSLVHDPLGVLNLQLPGILALTRFLARAAGGLDCCP